MKNLFTILILLFIVQSGFGQKDTLCIPKVDTLDGQIVYTVVEKKAEFNGGEESLYKYLAKNIKLKPDCNPYQGSIYSSFIVDTVGNIRNECVYSRFSKIEITLTEKAVLEVIKKMPKWIPAEQSGKKVYSRVMLPVKFKR